MAYFFLKRRHTRDPFRVQRALSRLWGRRSSSKWATIWRRPRSQARSRPFHSAAHRSARPPAHRHGAREPNSPPPRHRCRLPPTATARPPAPQPLQLPSLLVLHLLLLSAGPAPPPPPPPPPGALGAVLAEGLDATHVSTQCRGRDAAPSARRGPIRRQQTRGEMIAAE